MRRHVSNIFMRPLIASFVSTAVVFVVVYTLCFVAPQPQRALYAFWADPGQILFFSAAVVRRLRDTDMALDFRGPQVRRGPPRTAKRSRLAGASSRHRARRVE